MSNPFEQSEGWEVSLGQYLGVGNHLVTINAAADASAKSNGKPQLHLEMSNEMGEKQDWVNYSSENLRKIVGLCQATDLALPQDGEFDPNDDCRLTEKYIKRFVGRKVGIVVREEEYQGKKSARVQGYVHTSKLSGDDLPADTRGFAGVASSSAKADEPDVPF
jgi:hypothetical protein